MRYLRDLVLVVIGSQNKCVRRLYLDDADDFYFWFCQKIFTRKKVTPHQRFIPPLEINQYTKIIEGNAKEL